MHHKNSKIKVLDLESLYNNTVLIEEVHSLLNRRKYSIQMSNISLSQLELFLIKILNF